VAARRDEIRVLERQLTVLRDISKVREDFFRKERDVFQRDGQYRLLYLEAMRNLAQSERDMTQLRTAITSLETQIKTKIAQRDAVSRDWQARASQALAGAPREQAKLAEEYKKFDRANSLIESTAPTGAVVLFVKTQTPGTMLRSAEVLFELVPVDVPLEIE